MTTLKASTAGLVKIKQARKNKGWSVDDPKWLEEASRVLGIDWEKAGYLAEGISEGTWKRFLAGKRPINPEAFQAYSKVLGLDWQEIVNRGSVQDWGEAPESGDFYGRAEELASLQRWILKDKYRLITLMGMGGIGKTALAVKLAESTQDKFQYFIWRSLRYPPLLEDILADISQFFFPQQNSDGSVSIGTRLSQLVDCLRKHRCLLVLDNFEAILGEDDSTNKTLPYSAGSYRPGYEAYGELLRRLGESQHQSCLLLISREKSREIASLPGKSIQLNGLSEEEAKELLRARGLSGEEQWRTLTRLYRGNPLALNLVSATILELFNGNVPEFLKQNTLVITGIVDVLNQQFKRLSSLEKSVIYWLAIHRQPVLLSQLQTDILPAVKKSELMEVLQSLGWRSLIEKSTETDEVLFTLPPVVMKYVTNQFVEQAFEELCQGTIELLRTHALVTSEESNTKEVQLQPILTSLKDRLIAAFRSEKPIIKHLETILSGLKGQPVLEVGYAVDNIHKLLAELELSC